MKNVKNAALTAGIIWGVAVFLSTLAGVYFSYGLAFLNGLASIYPGFNISVSGSIIGLIYGFLDAFIGVYIIAWVYQRIAK